MSSEEEEIDELVAVATNPAADVYVRYGAILRLGSFDDEHASDVLIELLGDPSETVRSGAARGLGSIGSARAIPALSRAAFDGDGHVRIGAVRAPGQIGDPAAIPALVKVVETTSWGLLHEWATGSLAKLDAPEAEAPLIRHLLDGPIDPNGRKLNRWAKLLHAVPRWAAGHLGRLGTPAAIEPLKQARRRDLRHRRTYTRANEDIERRNQHDA